MIVLDRVYRWYTTSSFHFYLILDAQGLNRTFNRSQANWILNRFESNDLFFILSIRTINQFVDLQKSYHSSNVRSCYSFYLFKSKKFLDTEFYSTRIKIEFSLEPLSSSIAFIRANSPPNISPEITCRSITQFRKFTTDHWFGLYDNRDSLTAYRCLRRGMLISKFDFLIFKPRKKRVRSTRKK